MIAKIKPTANLAEIAAALQVAEAYGVHVEQLGPDVIQLEGEYAGEVVSAMKRLHLIETFGPVLGEA